MGVVIAALQYGYGGGWALFLMILLAALVLALLIVEILYLSGEVGGRNPGLTLLAIIVAVLIGLYTMMRDLKADTYRQAELLCQQSQYQRAKELYQLIPSYEDAAMQIRLCDWQSARWYMGRGQCIRAMELLDDYDDEQSRGLFQTAVEALREENAAAGLQLDAMLGEWRSGDKKDFFKVYTVEGDKKVSCNMYTHEGTYFRFRDGLHQNGDGEERWSDKLAFEYAGEDRATVRVYLFERRESVELFLVSYG